MFLIDLHVGVQPEQLSVGLVHELETVISACECAVTEGLAMPILLVQREVCCGRAMGTRNELDSDLLTESVDFETHRFDMGWVAVD